MSTNGLISFGRPFTSSSPELFPSTQTDIFWRYIAAAFWADWDTSDGGTVSWELHTSLESENLLRRVDTLIQSENGDTNFTGSWMLVSSWENVTNNISIFEVSWAFIAPLLINEHPLLEYLSGNIDHKWNQVLCCLHIQMWRTELV